MAVVYYLAALLLTAADQITKLLTRTYLAGGERVTLIPGVLGLTYVENTGMAFSAFSGYTAVLAVVSLVASVAIVLAIWKRWLPHPFCQWMLTLLLAGAVGNLIDRALFGYVTDMIEVLFVNFAVFNLADCCVVVGAFGLMGYLVRELWLEERRAGGKKGA